MGAAGPIEEYDAIVIGAGQAGGPLAGDLAKAGRKTALIERERLGGTCVNWGCTPTKTMVASARIAWLARRAAEYGVTTGRVAVDMKRVRRRKRAIVELFGGVEPDRGGKTPGLTRLFGDARFTGPRSLEVVMTRGGRVRALTAPQIFLNTGARPTRPPIPGLDQVDALDSTSIMELGELPSHLIVLGGGYIGVEFGQMFRRFGSRVTIVQRGEALLAREDPDVADAVAAILREEGIDLLLGAEAKGVARGGRGKAGAIRLTVSQAKGTGKSRARGATRTLTGSHLLVAIGRTPNTETLGLAAAGVAVDARGFVVVNERLETSAPGVYALGDVKGGPAFTHISYDDYRIVRTNLIERATGGAGAAERPPATIQGRLVPYTVFMDPELGRIGLTETEARAHGIAIRVARLGMDSVARALERDEPRGFIKVVVDAATDQILGAAILGIEGGELMSQLEIAMLGKVTAATLREAIFAHPTLAESWNNVFETIQA